MWGFKIPLMATCAKAPLFREPSDQPRAVIRETLRRLSKEKEKEKERERDRERERRTDRGRGECTCTCRFKIMLGGKTALEEKKCMYASGALEDMSTAC